MFVWRWFRCCNYICLPITIKPLFIPRICKWTPDQQVATLAHQDSDPCFTFRVYFTNLFSEHRITAPRVGIQLNTNTIYLEQYKQYWLEVPSLPAFRGSWWWPTYASSFHTAWNEWLGLHEWNPGCLHPSPWFHTQQHGCCCRRSLCESQLSIYPSTAVLLLWISRNLYHHTGSHTVKTLLTKEGGANCFCYSYLT